MEHSSELFLVLAIVGPVLGAVWFLLNKRLARLEVRLDKIEDDLKLAEADLRKTRENYLNRFDSLHRELAGMKEVILQRIFQLELTLVGGRKNKTIKRR